MAKPKNITNLIHQVDSVKYTSYTKEELENYLTVLKKQVRILDKTIKDLDYYKELDELKKKYGK